MPQHLGALNRARRVVANSKAVANVFAESGVSTELIEVIYSPIDVESFAATGKEAREILRTEWSITQDVFLIGIVGQIQDSKGHEELVQAAPVVISRVPRTNFVVVGSAFTDASRSFLAQLKRLIDELGLSGYFRFTGFRDDIPAVMRALDLLVVPSRIEPFRRVVVEGLAAGLPVIGTRVGGIPEILEDGENGVLVPHQLPEALAEAIVRLARDSNLRVTLAQRGPQSAQRFSVERHVAQVQTLYGSILGGGEERIR